MAVKGKSKRFTQSDVQRIVSATIEATINGMSTWLDSSDCILKNAITQELVPEITMEIADKEGNKMYAEIYKQLKIRGIEFSI